MPLKIDAATLNQTINELYRVRGLAQGSNKPGDALRVQGSAAGLLGNDQFVSSSKLQSLMSEPSSKFALNLTDTKHPLQTRKMAEAIANNLDAQDGKVDGRINITAKSLFDHVKLPGGKISLPTSHIVSELGTGFVVVGPGGQLMPKLWAKSQGKTILSIQDGKDGASLGLAK